MDRLLPFHGAPKYSGSGLLASHKGGHVSVLLAQKDLVISVLFKSKGTESQRKLFLHVDFYKDRIL